VSIELILLTIVTILEFVAFGFIVYGIKSNKAEQVDKEIELIKKIEDIEESIELLADAVTSLVKNVQEDFVAVGDLLQGKKR